MAARLPTRTEVLRFIENAPGKVTRREIIRAFGIRGGARAEFRQLLGEIAAQGLLGGGRRRPAEADAPLPRVAVLDITGRDIDGELLARPATWPHDAAPPTIVMAPAGGARRPGPAPGIGDRVLARLSPTSEGDYEARVIRRLDAAPGRVLGIYHEIEGSGRVAPTDKRARQELTIGRGDAKGAEPGELVIAEIVPGQRGRSRMGLKRAVIRERLGSLREPRSISLIAIHDHGIPTDFAADALAEAEAPTPAGPDGRVDLRHLPLVTIDPEDARDFDDAVWAAADDDPRNPGGWRLVVAIADVAHYVTPGSALDRDARERGNSVYFPDRVVPMLPEALSNDLCSLRSDGDRACVAVRMRIDARGEPIDHHFLRGWMRSAATLTYGQLQQARDGRPDEVTAPLMTSVVEPLYGAYAALKASRDRRRPLDLDLPERKITLDEAGNVTGVSLRQRLDAHKLIEEFMIRANVRAADTLVAHNRPTLFRVHEPPAREKLESLRDFLATLGLRLDLGGEVAASSFNAVLAKTAETANARVVNQVVLRSQSQAYYSPENQGHFGLSLGRYLHFTSPIRRYADLLVHRALIASLAPGKDRPGETEAEQMTEIGEHISMTERRAAVAERDSKDRYLAAFMADRIDAEFDGRISGVSRFGLFVSLEESGADGLVPMRTLRDDYYRHDESRHALVAEHGGLEYRLGTPVRVRLAESNPMTGGMRFEMLTPPAPGVRTKAKGGGKKGRQGRKKRFR